MRLLEREKDRFVLEANDTASKYQQAMQEVALRDAAILELQKLIAGAFSASLHMQHFFCFFLLNGPEDSVHALRLLLRFVCPSHSARAGFAARHEGCAPQNISHYVLGSAHPRGPACQLN